ncbi:hypothetical protein BJF79_32925 [Actinomadura sp. CNU-125]|nr:hypothetical protein [Actinomadura sp. CNU-125]OLT34788.1 hypothetical protein BJF79_32925 [Actinomadura sp. CNU-125]
MNTSPSGAAAARNSISPASMCPRSVTNRNDAGVRSTTRTGQFHGPGMWTRYSSPTSTAPAAPAVLSKTATSTGAAALRSSPSRPISCSGVSGLPAMRTVYRRR